ncbi:MAG: PHP domain-containing protein [Candidatus Diapherotrites archaeon]
MPLRIDMHMHSHYSCDAITKPETMIKTAKKKNLGIAITDHNNCKAWGELKSLAKQHNVPLILGEEIKVFDKGKVIGELLGFFMNHEAEPAPYLDVIDALHAQDAFVSIPHPFDTFRKPFQRIEQVKHKVDAVEIFNARGYTKSFNEETKEFVEKNKLAFTAGSDAHTPEEIGNAYIEAEATDLEEFRKLLKKGNVKYNGELAPFTVHIKTQLAKYGILKPR